MIPVANNFGSLRVLAGGRPHSFVIRTTHTEIPILRLSYLPPLLGRITDPSEHYAIIVGNDAKAITTAAGYERPR